jgi:gluconolactonase
MSYFAPPPIIPTTVFARLPDEFREPREPAWDVNLPGHRMDSFLEGPSFDTAGHLHVTDIPNGRIYRIDQQGRWSVVMSGLGKPNGLKIHRDGRFFIADSARGIMIGDPATGRVEEFVGAETHGLKGVNDLIFAPNGDLYFTDQGHTGLHDATGRVFRCSPAGELTCLLDNVPSPNGIVLHPSLAYLFVAATRSNEIWRVPLHPDGSVVKVGLFARLHGGMAGPDGMALDQEGALCVAHAGYGVVWRFSADGEPIGRIQGCTGKFTTNVAFGGPQGRTLFITESETGTILQAEMPAAGAPLFSHS